MMSFFYLLIALLLLSAPTCIALPPLPWIQERADKLERNGKKLITEDFTGDPDSFRRQPVVSNSQGIDITYLGSGGFLFQRDTTAILTAPYFSNESLQRVGVWSIEADTATIDQYRPDLKAVQAILVGHPHYDHLLDVPYVWKKHAPHTRVFGNQSMANILDSAVPKTNLHVLDNEVRVDKNSGAFVSSHGGLIQFMPLHSSHAPNIRIPLMDIEYLIAPRSVDEPLDEVPQQARDWRLGETLAYIIDFRAASDTAKVEFRIYYQDAGHMPESWHLPADGRRVDLAIVTVASANFIGQGEYIQTIRDSLRPRHWLLGHWEDFFQPYSQNPEEIYSVPFTNTESFVDTLIGRGIGGDEWVLPTPGTKLAY